ncbi:MAG: hypothetical protein LQ343_007530 [Gyalolechia ehrenbergii]|nr:MAG: hypothetical protein LQ343_007530 [Gyalolechia ehrenbergii]
MDGEHNSPEATPLQTYPEKAKLYARHTARVGPGIRTVEKGIQALRELSQRRKPHQKQERWLQEQLSMFYEVEQIFSNWREFLQTMPPSWNSIAE